MNKTAAIIFLNFIFIFMLTIIFGMLKYNPTPLLNDVIEIKDVLYDVSVWDKLLYTCLLLFVTVVGFSVIYLTFTAYRWNKLYFYDKSIFRSFNFIGITYTVIGIMTFISSANSVQSKFHNVRIVEISSLDVKQSIFIITIGLLFFLITAILTEAKKLQEENDLTI